MPLSVFTCVKTSSGIFPFLAGAQRVRLTHVVLVLGGNSELYKSSLSLPTRAYTLVILEEATGFFKTH